MRERSLVELRPHPAASLCMPVLEFDHPRARSRRRLAFKFDESPPQFIFIRFVVLGPRRSLHEQLVRPCAAQQLRDAPIQRRRLCEAVPDRPPCPVAAAESFRRGEVPILLRIETEIGLAPRPERTPACGLPPVPHACSIVQPYQRGPGPDLMKTVGRSPRLRCAAPMSARTGVVANSVSARPIDCRVSASRATSSPRPPSLDTRNASTVQSRPLFCVQQTPRNWSSTSGLRSSGQVSAAPSTCRLTAGR